MSVNIYLFKLYLALTFTKYKQEADNDLSVCVVERRSSIAYMFLNPS